MSRVVVIGAGIAGLATAGLLARDGHDVTVLTRGGDGIAWVTTWDSRVDAGEFFSIIDTLILKRYRGAKPTAATSEARTYDVSGRTVYVATAEISGHPVVLYVDVPSGAPTNVLDLTKVTFQ